ncbi:MAG: hypothetical protein NC225_02505 [Clostridium sp.]|nr:hypothetical protein [Clostridium sp.]MCM1398334.1 hypothetical protein [Clostridium sp.]MCM1459001.1 hypothetical protein [Bacteroides sp.]
MSIIGIGNNYNDIYGSIYTYKKNDVGTEAQAREAASSRTSGEKNMAKSDASDYYSYIAKKYDCVRNGNVVISSAYLKECANNADKAKELGESLAFYKESCKSGYENAKANARGIGAKLTNYSESWSIDNKGNIIMQASATVVSDTKGWRELKEEQEERLKKKKEQEEQLEKLKERREDKKREDIYYQAD